MGDLVRILVAGGDCRSSYLANKFYENGFDISVVCLEKCTKLMSQIDVFKDLKDALNYADVIVLPLPFSRDNVTLNAPFAEKSLKIKDLFGLLEPRHTIFGGMMSDKIISQLEKRKINAIDYYKCEDLIIKNALATAEGAISLIISSSEKTIHGSKILVSGFGKIGKMLTRILIDLKAKVSVSARKITDFAWIEGYSATPVDIREIDKYKLDFDVIINTVPHQIFSEKSLKKLPKDCIYIELASHPFGTDFDTAKRVGIKTINAQGLPGTYSPKSAAGYIYSAITNILKEQRGDFGGKN